MSPVSCPLSPGLGLFLHASSVVIEDRALLFLGHSTAGKSTMARLLGEVAPVLADDSVYAFRGEDGEWRVVDGGFRFEDGGLTGWQASVRQRTRQGGVRLGACLRLRKAAKTRFEQIYPCHLARYLMDAAMEIDVQRKAGKTRFPDSNNEHIIIQGIEIRKKWFRWVSQMARMIPGDEFWFSLDENPANLVKIMAKICRQSPFFVHG